MSRPKHPTWEPQAVADGFTVDFDSLAGAVERMAQFGRIADALLAEPTRP